MPSSRVALAALTCCAVLLSSRCDAANNAAPKPCASYACLDAIADADAVDTQCRMRPAVEDSFREAFCYCCGGVYKYVTYGPVCRRYCKKVAAASSSASGTEDNTDSAAGKLYEPCAPKPGLPEEYDGQGPFPEVPTLLPVDMIVCQDKGSSGDDTSRA